MRVNPSRKISTSEVVPLSCSIKKGVLRNFVHGIFQKVALLEILRSPLLLNGVQAYSIEFVRI